MTDNFLNNSIITIIASTVIIIVIYGIVLITERKKFMKIWIWSWVFQLVRHIFIFISIENNNSFNFCICQISALLSAFFLLWGGINFAEKALKRSWFISFGLVALWTILGTIYTIPALLLMLPVYALLSFANIWNGILYLKFDKNYGKTKNILGITFFIWAVHRFDYLFVYKVEWFLPYGYILGAILEFIVAILTMQLFMKNIKSELIKTQEILIENEHKLKNSLEEAKLLQSKLLPEKLPQYSKLSIIAEYFPAEKVGGDIYDIFRKNNQIIVYLVDVSGHGIPAAMMSTYIKASLKYYFKNNKIIEPGHVLNYIRDIIAEENLFDNSFVTMFIACIDLDSLNIKYANAGQCYPIVQCDKQIKYLKNSQHFLSKYYKATNYETFQYQFFYGDKLLLYTDGLYEWKDKDEFFGLQNFIKYLEKNKLSKGTLNNLVECAVKKGDNIDDISYVLMKFNENYINSVKSTRDSLGEMLDKLYIELNNKNCIRSMVTRIMQAGTEMLTNAFEHGNKFNPDKEVTLRLLYEKDLVKLIINDEGEGFDWREKIKKHEVSPNLLRGRGIILTKFCSDEMMYNNKGDEVIIFFRRETNT